MKTNYDRLYSKLFLVFMCYHSPAFPFLTGIQPLSLAITILLKWFGYLNYQVVTLVLIIRGPTLVLFRIQAFNSFDYKYRFCMWMMKKLTYEHSSILS